MADIVVNFLQSGIKNPYIIVLLVAMFPLIELKGAIPIGIRLGLNLWESAGLSFIGSTLVTVPIFFLLLYVFTLLKKIPLINKLVYKLEAIFERKAEKISQNKNDEPETIKQRFFKKALFIFVAVPLPLTGVWTGTAIAVFLNMKFRNAIVSLALGNLVAGTFITLITFLFKDYVDIIITGILIIAVIMLIVLIIKIAVSKPKQTE